MSALISMCLVPVRHASIGCVGFIEFDDLLTPCLCVVCGEDTDDVSFSSTDTQEDAVVS